MYLLIVNNSLHGCLKYHKLFINYTQYHYRVFLIPHKKKNIIDNNF